MPGRAFIPAEHTTDSLNEMLNVCRYQEDNLANKHGDTFLLWGRSNIAGNQELTNNCERECKNLRRKITMNVNKMYKIRAELDSRFLQELRAPRR